MSSRDRRSDVDDELLHVVRLRLAQQRLLVVVAAGSAAGRCAAVGVRHVSKGARRGEEEIESRVKYGLDMF